MAELDLLLPVFVQVGLTLALMLWMAYLRTNGVRRREVRIADIALGQSNWPEKTTKVANAYHNQFELPVLFYVLVILVLLKGQVTLALVVLAWVFVAARIVHAAIHTGTNYVPRRFQAFVVSVLALVAMWLLFALQVLAG
jgi:hypothetical protein